MRKILCVVAEIAAALKEECIFGRTDDTAFENTPVFAWLVKNAAAHGFELSFPKGNPQGVNYEPWHWRFVGDADARGAFHPD